MNETFWTRRVVWSFAVGGVLVLLASAVLGLLTTEQLTDLLRSYSYVHLRSPVDVAFTLQRAPKILLKIAGTMLAFAGLGLGLMRFARGHTLTLTDNPNSFRWPPPLYTLAVAGISLAVGISLTYPRLGGSLWCDEANHVACALGGSWLNPWLVGGLENMRFYSYVMRAVTTAFGFSETLLRLPSVLTYCVFGWFLAIISWNQKNRVWSGATGVCLMLAFLLAPGAIYTAAQARGHMAAAVCLAVSLWCFVRACGRATPWRWLILCVLFLGVSISLVMTGVAALAAIWLVLSVTVTLRRALLPSRIIHAFYGATAITLAALFVVYAPMLLRFITWMAGDPQWRAFGVKSVLPWTLGWIECVPLLVLTWVVFRSVRNEPALAVIPMSVVAVWGLIFIQHHAKFIYAAGSGTTLALLGAMAARRLDPLVVRRPVAWSVMGILALSCVVGIRDRIHDIKTFAPESLARDQVAPIRQGDRVLLIGHCSAPRFYLARQKVGRVLVADDRKHLTEMLASTTVDWIVLNGAALGDPKEIVADKVIPEDRYQLASSPPYGAEEVWTWQRREPSSK